MAVQNTRPVWATPEITEISVKAHTRSGIWQGGSEGIVYDVTLNGDKIGTITGAS